MAIFRGDGGAGDANTDITINSVTQKASEAAASATAAASSATSAATSASNASTSESNASTSATAAAASASSAATSATNASTSASTASTQASNASTSATAASTAQTAAEAAQTAAETAETNAGTSATNAAASATTATTKASEASTSATNAATSATNAATSETNAATSETNAASSATSASSSATSASTSASNAATSETNAASSATSAASSATTATTQASNASTSATNAATSESNAASSASAAATSASNASTSETNAASSASSASTSATNASNSASAASTSATNAATSETNAASSASAAATSASNAATSETNAAASATAAAAELSTAALKANNLSDLASASTARTNLGLGTAATTASTDYATAAQGTTADSALQNVVEDTTPQLGGDLDTNSNHIYTANGGIVTRPNVKPIIINGNMAIAQRSTSQSGQTGNHFPVDRFGFQMSNFGTWTSSQSTDVPTGEGFATSLKIDCTTADTSLGAGDFGLIHYRIEGQDVQLLKKGTASAEKVTVSFWVKSAKTGTYVLELFDNDNSRQISQSYTISSANTWEQKVLVFDADTTGTLGNDNGNSFILHFWLGAGSTYSGGTLSTTWTTNTNADRAVGVVNLADSTSNDWYLTGVQLEVGDYDSTTVPAFQFETITDNQNRCSRYYQKLASNNNQSVGEGFSSDGSGRGATMIPFLPMRASPTITTSAVSTFKFQQGVTTSGASSSFIVKAVNNNQGANQGQAYGVGLFRVHIDCVITSATFQDGRFCRGVSNGDSFVEVDAEL